jgi:Rieske Fe-S protein
MEPAKLVSTDMETNRSLNLAGSEPVIACGASQSRRQFIKSFVVGTAFSTILGKEWLGTLLADCQPAPAGGGILRVKVSDFPALANANGSVRLALNSFTQNGPTGAFYPILVNRESGNQFFALSTRCMHAFCVVPPYSTAASASVCPCHQSRYRIDGTVIPGSLSLQSLTRFPVVFDGGDLLCIEVSNLGYSLTGTTVESGVGPRFRLQFTTKQNVKYEVRFRQSMSDAGTVVPFSTTEGGTASTMVLTGGNNTTATLYIDRTTASGFYSVAVQVAQA